MGTTVREQRVVRLVSRIIVKFLDNGEREIIDMIAINNRSSTIMSNEKRTGYGPRYRLYFDGDGDKYELWEVKFLGYLRTLKLHDVVTATATPTEATDIAAAVDKNAQVFGELVQLLDDTSLSLIIRDARDKGKEALQILRDHYLGTGKPRIISLYTELTSLKMTDERVTDYVIRAETASASLKAAGETISESLLVAMALKGLPQEYKTFCTVVTQRKDPMTFQEFKTALRSFEETERSQNSSQNSEHSVMHVRQGDKKYVLRCYRCNKIGHKANECPDRGKSEGRNRQRRWCKVCKSPTHDTSYCKYNKNNAVKTVSDRYEEEDKDNHNFAFKVSTVQRDSFKSDTLLVDCGATTHIVTEKSKFTEFDEKFKPTEHVIELADGSRQHGVAKGRGEASLKIYDVNDKLQDVVLKNALYVPSYNNDIFSVKAATERGASLVFTPEYSRLIAKDGTAFEVENRGKLYFLNNVSTCSDIQKKKSHTLQEWHSILGHCNVKDVLKLENIVKGMHISNKSDFNCETCVMGKMTQYTNRAPDKKAERNLELVHCDIAGPVSPIAREGFKYAINFVDDYSGATSVYFLKNKSGAVAAMERFIADSSPYGNMKRFRRDNAREFTSDEFNSILVKNRIKSELSCPYSPHQNGTAERSWRTLFEMARCLLLEAGLPKKLWTYAVKASAYIRNRCYNPRLGKTPFEALTGEKPSLANMHTFGTICYAYLQNKKKLDARCEKGIFVGYDSQSPAFLVYFPNRDDVKKVRCVTFSETLAENMKMPGVNKDYHYCQPNSAEKEENISVQQEESGDEQADSTQQVEPAGRTIR